MAMPAPNVRAPVHQPLATALQAARCGAALAGALRMDSDAGEVRDLTQPLLDAVRLFEALDIRYALVGGLAAMVYGRARFTLDVDFIAQSGHEAVLQANPEAMRRCHFDPGCTWKLYHDSGGEIDLWKDEFADDLIGRARTETLAGRGVRVVEPHDLIAMKLRANRPQDDYDIGEVARGTPIDDATIRQRVTAEQFQRYREIRRRVGLP